MYKIIYLDQNKWIELSRAYFGKINDNNLINICKKLIDLSELGKIMVPLSASHLIETGFRINQESRERLAKFMSILSKTRSILPYYCVTHLELENALMKRYNNSIIDVKSKVFGKGIFQLLGAKPILSGAITNNTKMVLTEEVINKICKEMNFPQSLKNNLLNLADKETTVSEVNDILMKDDEIFYHILKDSHKSKFFRNTKKQSIEEIEKLRFQNKKKIKDKKLRYQIVLKENVTAILSKKIIDFHLKLGLPLNAIIKEDWEFSNLIEFLKDIPTFYSQFHLMYGRDRDYNKPIHEHDLFDISSLAIAIPYCNIVVCEKRFASIAKQFKLDKIYETIILTDIKTLDKYL